MLCIVHNLEYKLVPAGVSKSTGRAYQAFWACPERGCKQRPPANPQGDAAPRPVERFAANLDKDAEEMKWREIGAQKNRSNLAAAWIQSNRPFDEHTFKRIALCEGYVLNGKVEVKAPAPKERTLEEKIATLEKPVDAATPPKTEAQQRAEGDAIFESLKDIPF